VTSYSHCNDKYVTDTKAKHLILGLMK